MIPLLTLAAGRARLRLAPALGGSIADWHLGATPVMRPVQPGALEEGNPRGLASYPLVPLSNRVAGNRFSFAGLTHALPALLGGQYIHGAGWQLPWTVTDSGPAHATLALDFSAGALWPFAFQAEQRFLLAENGLRHDLAVRNTAEHPAPLALGTHPFFPRTPGTTLRFSAAQVWQQDAQRIPTTRMPVPPEWSHDAGLPVGPLVLDHVFADWGGRARITWPEHGLALSIAADRLFHHAVLYTPEGRDFFAFEPVANMTDGINRIDGQTEHGMAILRPGESLSGIVRYILEPA